MKTLFSIPGNLISSGRYVITLQPNVVTVAGTAFVFPTNTEYLTTVTIPQESAFEDVTFRFQVLLSSVVAGSKFGVYLIDAADLNNGEKAGFILTSTSVDFYVGNTFVESLASFDIATLAGGDGSGAVTVSLRRLNDWYYLTVGSLTVSKRIQGDGGAYYRQNVKLNLWGSNVTATVKDVRFFTNAGRPDWAGLGDSILQAYLAGAGASYENSIGGILRGEYGINYREFAGSASIIKDQIDAFSEVVILNPKRTLIVFGHNDLYFGTGRHITDLNKLVAMAREIGSDPLVCTLPYSPWVDVEATLNPHIRKTYPNYLELFGVTTYPGDYNSGPHQNVTGIRKLAVAIYNRIK